MAIRSFIAAFVLSAGSIEHTIFCDPRPRTRRQQCYNFFIRVLSSSTLKLESLLILLQGELYKGSAGEHFRVTFGWVEHKSCIWIRRLKRILLLAHGAWNKVLDSRLANHRRGRPVCPRLITCGVQVSYLVAVVHIVRTEHRRNDRVLAEGIAASTTPALYKRSRACRWGQDLPLRLVDRGRTRSSVNHRVG